MTTLYRATSATPHHGTGSHWTPAREAAEAYLDNPGFGGPVLYSAEVEHKHALDLCGASFCDLADELLTDEEFAAWAAGRFGGDEDTVVAADLADWLKSITPGGYIYETWEESRIVREALARGYDWVRYDDSYPARCETWRYLGDGTITAEVCE